MLVVSCAAYRIDGFQIKVIFSFCGGTVPENSDPFCIHVCMSTWSDIPCACNTHFNAYQKSEDNRSNIEQAGAILCNLVNFLARNGYVNIHNPNCCFCLKSFCTDPRGIPPMHMYIIFFSNTHAFTTPESQFPTDTLSNIGAKSCQETLIQ